MKKDTQKRKVQDQQGLSLQKQLINKKGSTQYSRRLVRDFMEFESMNLPGIAAHPTNNDLKEWRINLKGPKGSLQEGGVYHMKLIFPTDQPNKPPALKVMTRIPCHPNICNGTEVCLDILDGDRNQSGRGWTSAYTASTILIQLQNFLFVLNEKAYKNIINIPEIEKAKVEANEFEDAEVGHQGSSNPWPKFKVDEEKKSEPTFMEMVKSELRCQHSRVKQNENPIGILVKVERNFRKGTIDSIKISKELVCLRSFMKEGLKKDFDNEDFKQWLPLYFGKIDSDAPTPQHLSQFTHLFKNSVSMISTKSTRKFDEYQLVEVVPNILKTLIINLFQSIKQISLREVRMLIQIMRILKQCMDTQPRFHAISKEKLDIFINNPDKRIKKFTPNLADVLIFSIISKDYDQQQFKWAYFQEKMDRNVLWVLKKIPEIEKEDCPVSMEDRLKITFNLARTGAYFTVMASYIKNILNSDTFIPVFDDNCGRCNITEDRLQKKFKEIQNIDNFADQFKELNLPAMTNDDLNKILLQSIKNSKAKGYHGDSKDINKLPEPIVMFRNTCNNYGEFILDKKAQLSLLTTEPAWKSALLARQPVVKFICGSLQSLDENQLKKMVISHVCFGQEEFNDRDQYLKNKFDNEEIQYAKVNPVLHKVFKAELTWKDVQLACELYKLTSMLNYTQDFKTQYQVLDNLKDMIEVAIVPIIKVAKLKSDQQYLAQFFTKLTKLKQIHFRGLTDIGSNKISKNIIKGLNNFNGDSDNVKNILVVSFHNCMYNGSFDCFQQFYEKQMSVTTVGLFNCNVNAYSIKALNEFLINLKQIKHIQVDHCEFASSKPLADTLIRCRTITEVWLGLMRKNLIELENFIQSFSILPIEYLWLNFEPLDFVTKVQSPVPFQNGAYPGRNPLTESGNLQPNLEKLIEISTRLKELQILSNDYIKSFNFLNKLMLNTTISKIQIEGLKNSTAFLVKDQLKVLGSQIAINNHLKNGLTNFRISLVKPNSSNFFEGVSMSKKNLQKTLDTLRNTSTADKLTDQSQQQISNQSTLESLTINTATQINFGELNNAQMMMYRVGMSWENLVYKKFAENNYLFKFLNENKNLKFLSLGMNVSDINYFFEVLTYSQKEYQVLQNLVTLKVSSLAMPMKNLLKKVTPNEIWMSSFAKMDILKNLKNLDLSHCHIGVGGAKQFSKFLEDNKSVETLNLEGNRINVSGCKFISDALRKNTSIRQLNLALNLIKGKGLKEIKSAIIENKHSALEILDVRMNSIRIETLISFINSVKVQNKTKLKWLQIKRNNFTLIHTYELLDFIHKNKIEIFADVLLQCMRVDDNFTNLSVQAAGLPYSATESKLRDFLDKHDLGIITNISIYQNWYKKKGGGKHTEYKEKFAQVTFSDENSLQRCLNLNSCKQSLDGHSSKMTFSRIGAKVD